MSIPTSWLIATDYDPNEHTIKLKTKDYLEVQQRLIWFIRDQRALIQGGHATGSYLVQTELVSEHDNWAEFRTTVRDVLGNEATMYGSESQKDFPDYREKASTKSLGRALVMLGYGTQFAPEISDGEEDRPVDSPTKPKAAPSAPKPKPATPPKGPVGLTAKQQLVADLCQEHGITKAGLMEWMNDPQRHYTSQQESHLDAIITALQDDQARHEIQFHALAQSKVLAASTLLHMMRQGTKNQKLTMRDAWVAYNYDDDSRRDWDAHIANEVKSYQKSA